MTSSPRNTRVVRVLTRGCARCRYLFNDAEVKSFDSAQLASECFGGEMTVRSKEQGTWARVSPDDWLTSRLSFRRKLTTPSPTSSWISLLRRWSRHHSAFLLISFCMSSGTNEVLLWLRRHTVPTCSSTRGWSSRRRTGRTSASTCLLIYWRYCGCAMFNYSNQYFYIYCKKSCFHVCVSSSGSGTTTCSSSRIKIYLSTLTSGGFQICSLLEWTDGSVFSNRCLLFSFMWQLCSSIPSTLPDPKAVSLMTAKVSFTFYGSESGRNEHLTLEFKIKPEC